MESRAQVSLSPASPSRLEGPGRQAGARPLPGQPEGEGRTFRTPAAAAALRQRFWQRAALALAAGLFLAGLGTLLPLGPPGGRAQDSPPAGGPAPSALLFRGWGKPAVAIVLSGEMHGYLQPCGCSRPQLGGLARRYNFLQTLKARGWPVVAADLGDLAQRGGPQKMLKYKTAMKALDLLGYTAVGIGQNEMAMPLIEALGNYALNNPTPHVLAANLADRNKGELYHGMVEALEVAARPGTPRVGVTALVGAGVADKVKDPSVKLVPAVRQILGDLRARKVDLVVMLYQGSFEEARKCAAFCAACRKDDATLPAVDAMVCLSGEDDEPPGVPDRVGRTQIIRLGHKARYVGVVGAFRTGQAALPYELRYQLVPITEDYETKAGQEAGNPLLPLMEDYAKDVKRGNFLGRYPRSQHPVQVAFPNARYVGSHRCKRCHEDAYAVWEKSGHAHAYQSLERARHPSLRQYDGECVACHVVGFAYKTGFSDEVSTPKLLNVGCESCHGPGSEHINDKHNAKIHAVMNPWKAVPNEAAPARRLRELQIDKFCQTCHDIDNDVHWDFTRNWPKVVHHMAKRQGAAAQAAPAAPAVQPEAPAVQPEAPGPALEQVDVPQTQPAPRPTTNPQPAPRQGIFRFFRRRDPQQQ
jgi:hypothetical protein